MPLAGVVFKVEKYDRGQFTDAEWEALKTGSYDVYAAGDAGDPTAGKASSAWMTLRTDETGLAKMEKSEYYVDTSGWSDFDSVDTSQAVLKEAAYVVTEVSVPDGSGYTLSTDRYVFKNVLEDGVDTEISIDIANEPETPPGRGDLRLLKVDGSGTPMT